MPGAQLYNPRLGSSSELLAEFILNRIAFTTRVPRQEDVGHDFVCSLSEHDGAMVKAGPSFTVQVKSDRSAIAYEGSHKIDWIQNQENPFFICVADRAQLSIELYSTWNMLNGFLKRGAPKVILRPGGPDDPFGEVTWDSNGNMNVPLGQPIIRLTAQDAIDDVVVSRIGRVLRDWIELDRGNLVNRFAAMYWVLGPVEYQTNESLIPNTRLQIGFYWNPNNLAGCLLNFGRCATALRTVLAACAEQGIPNTYRQDQLGTLEAAIQAHAEYLEPLAVQVLRDKTTMEFQSSGGTGA
jgi:hypothetical protein